MLVYLDNAATTPIHPDVVDAMAQVLKEEFYVPNTSRAVAARTVLTTGSGFGGFQSAMVLRTLEVAR